MGRRPTYVSEYSHNVHRGQTLEESRGQAREPVVRKFSVWSTWQGKSRFQIPLCRRCFPWRGFATVKYTRYYTSYYVAISSLQPHLCEKNIRQRIICYDRLARVRDILLLSAWQSEVEAISLPYIEPSAANLKKKT